MKSIISDIADQVGNEPYHHFNGSIITGPPHAFPYQEDHADEGLASMRLQQWKPNHCHIGLGGFFNLDVAATGAPYVILCDINSNQGPYWDKVFKLIDENETRQDFVQALCKRPDLKYCRVNHKQRFDSEAKIELSRPGGWLSNDYGYSHIRKLVKEARIQFITLDITDTDKAKKLRDYLIKKNLEPGSIFLSNVALLLTGQQGFYQQQNPANAVDKMCRSLVILSYPSNADIIASGLQGIKSYHNVTYDPLAYSLSDFREIIRERNHYESRKQFSVTAPLNLESRRCL